MWGLAHYVLHALAREGSPLVVLRGPRCIKGVRPVVHSPGGGQLYSELVFASVRFQLEKETSFTTKKGRSVDNSISRAYTDAIRRARRFIYIENQVRAVSRVVF